MKRALCTALLLLLCLAAAVSCAFAELKKGDSGEAVRDMQSELKDLGFLDGAADGKFGPVTEQAVRAFHLWRWNEEGSGVMTDDDLYWLNAVHALAFGEEEESASQPDTCSLPASCCFTDDSVLHCERHLNEQTLLFWLNYNSAPLTLQKLLLTQLRDAWDADIEALYDEWSLTDPAAAEQQRALFHEYRAEQRTEWLKENTEAFPIADTDNETAIDVDLLQRETAWLDAVGTGLCFDLHGAEVQP